MTSLRRLVHRRSWPQPAVTDPEPGTLYAARDLGLPFTKCRGVYIGECISADEAYPDSTAHAHITGEHVGIICIDDGYYVWEKGSWIPRAIMWHEYAHLLAGEDDLGLDHDPSSQWASIMTGWGLRASRVS